MHKISSRRKFLATGLVAGSAAAISEPSPAQAATAPTDVRAFGAVGDGRTGDARAIQAAVDAGGRLEFPPGDYVVDKTIVVKQPIQIVGGGQGVTKIRLETGDGIHASSVNGLSISSLDFYAPDRPEGHSNAILVEDCSNVQIRDCSASNVGFFVSMWDSQIVRITNNRIEKSYYAGIVLGESSPGRLNEWIWVTDNIIRNAQSSLKDGNAAIQCRSNGAEPWHDRNVVVANNQIIGAGIVGIGMDGCDSLLIQGNRVILDREANGECIAFCGEDIRVSNNYLFNRAGAACCLLWAADFEGHGRYTRNAIVSDNIMDHNTSPASQCIALVTHGNDQLISNVIISNNILRNVQFAVQAYTTGGTIGHGLRNIYVTGNLFSGLTDGPANFAMFPVFEDVVLNGNHPATI